MFNKKYPSMAQKRAGDKAAIHLCNKHTAELAKVNKKILYYLDRLPLEDQKQIVELNRLIETQEKLVRVRIKGHVPLRIEIFNDNERYRANHLRRRFREAQRRDKIRKTADSRVDSQEKKDVYFGNKRSPVLHLPECHWVKKMAPKNMVLFTSRQDAINQGYAPCKACKP